MGVDLENLKPMSADEVEWTDLPKESAITGAVDNCLSVMSTGSMRCKGSLFVKGWEGEMDLTDFSFLVEHGSDKLLFDLGLRKNLEYEGMKKDLQERWQAEARHSIPELLADFPNVSIDTISWIVLSHLHFDHVGLLEDFPTSAGLVLGPGLEELSTEELAKKLKTKSKALEGRKIRYLSREKDEWKQIGSFKGHDFYGDGSVWILDMPGHATGHIGMLVQTAPDAWHCLAGDAAHHVSLIDPTPTSIGVFKAKENPISDQSDADRLTTFEDDPEESVRTMAKLARMDQDECVTVWLSHDYSLLELVSKGSEKLSGDVGELEGYKHRDRGEWPIKK